MTVPGMVARPCSSVSSVGVAVGLGPSVLKKLLRKCQRPSTVGPPKACGPPPALRCLPTPSAVRSARGVGPKTPASARKGSVVNSELCSTSTGVPA